MEIAVYSMRPCLSVEVDDIYVPKTRALPIAGNTKPVCIIFMIVSKTLTLLVIIIRYIHKPLFMW